MEKLRLAFYAKEKETILQSMKRLVSPSGYIINKDGWNGHSGMRYFGKVLNCIPGLQKGAQFTLAAQFYFLNPDSWHPRSDARSELVEERADKVETNGDCPDPTAESPTQ